MKIFFFFCAALCCIQTSHSNVKPNILRYHTQRLQSQTEPFSLITYSKDIHFRAETCAADFVYLKTMSGDIVIWVPHPQIIFSDLNIILLQTEKTIIYAQAPLGRITVNNTINNWTYTNR